MTTASRVCGAWPRVRFPLQMAFICKIHAKYACARTKVIYLVSTNSFWSARPPDNRRGECRDVVHARERINDNRGTRLAARWRRRRRSNETEDTRRTVECGAHPLIRKSSKLTSKGGRAGGRAHALWLLCSRDACKCVCANTLGCDVYLSAKRAWYLFSLSIHYKSFAKVDV